MRKYISLTILVILVAFNIYLRIPATPDIDKQLIPYVETFKQLCKTYGKDCSITDKFNIKFKDFKPYHQLYEMLGFKGRVIGHCWRDSREIDISIEYYLTAHNAEIEQLLVHELGHCVLDLEHTEEDKLAIMNPYSLYYTAYLAGYNELMNDFFGCKENCPVVKFNKERY
jgi:hypothetical protein